MTAQLITAVSGIYIACYLIGSINFSLLFSKMVLRHDLRSTGSGNPGFTNLLRLGNKKIAITVLILDIARAWGVIFFTQFIPMNTYWPFLAVPLLLGNLFPVFHQFKGGKGIAMSIGIIFAACPVAGAAGVLALILTIAIWKRVSVGSLSFLGVATVTSIFMAPAPVWMVCIFLTVAGASTHRENLNRLIKGEEPRLFSGK